MELQLSPEQQQIVESAETFLAKASAMTQVRAHTQSKAHMDPALWSAMADLGWCGVHLPESDMVKGRTGRYCSESHRQAAGDQLA